MQWEWSGDGFTDLSSWSRRTPLTSAYAFRGAIRGRRRPLCVRAPRFRGLCGARTGTDSADRSGMLTARPGILGPAGGDAP